MRLSFIIAGVFIAVIIFLWQIPAISQVLSGGLLSAAKPLWRAEEYVSSQVNTYAAAFRSKQKLQDENEVLTLRARRLEIQLLRQRLLEEENQELKALLGRSEGREHGILAAVLSKPGRAPYDTLLLDIGTKDGVNVGDKVRAQGEVILGTIQDVFSSSAKVVLFSSPGEEIEVRIGEENIAARAYGVGGGNFKAQLPRGVDVKEGDIISFPSMDTRIAGVVERIKVSPSDQFQTILFKSPVNLFELKYVEILTNDSRNSFTESE